MGLPTTESKKSWNREHYTTIAVALDKDLAVDFKAKCKLTDRSVASYFVEWISAFCEREVRPSKARVPKENLKTRGDRRKAVKNVIALLERIKESESEYFSKIPESFEGTSRYSASEESISKLEEALDILREAF